MSYYLKSRARDIMISVILLVNISQIALAQNAGDNDPSFFTNDMGLAGTGAQVLTSLIQPDGKIILGGNFITFGGTPQGHIVRLNADGSLDTSFDTGVGFDNNVRSLTLGSNGQIVAAGSFASFNGTSTGRIARLNSDGTLDTSFNPGTGANGVINSTALQSDGKIIVGGSFTSFNGSQGRIARLNVDGSLDNSFNTGTGVTTNAGTFINSIVIQPDDRIIIGGGFSTYNGVSIFNVALLNSDGTLNTSFQPTAPTSQIPGPNGSINKVLLQPDGKIIIAGVFSQYSGVTIKSVARIDLSGALDLSFNTMSTFSSTPTINAIALQSDGKILVSTDFSSFRLNADGSVDGSFSEGGANIINSVSVAGKLINTIALQPDGKILIGGNFKSINNVSRSRIARLNADGTLDLSFLTTEEAFNDRVSAIRTTSDGYLVGGAFNSVHHQYKGGITKLDMAGNLDPTFSAAYDLSIKQIAVQSDGKILIAWNNGSIAFNETNIYGLARLNPGGTVDPTFNAGIDPANGQVLNFAVQGDGKILIVGYFGSFNNQSVIRYYVARLNADGSIDQTFDAGLASSSSIILNAVAVQPDGKILVGGQFTSFNGVTKYNIVRLNADGSIDPTFNATSTVGGPVTSIKVLSDGKILVSGGFGTKLVRLKTDGSYDHGSISSGFNSLVESVEIQPDGKMLVGGHFNSYDGISRNHFARLNSDFSLDGTFNVGTGTSVDAVGAAAQLAAVYAIVYTQDGRIMIGGDFNNYNGNKRDYIARVFGDVPTIPMALSAVSISDTEIVLSWAASNDATITGYQIERSLSSGTGFTQIASISSTSFNDVHLTGGTQYYYRIKAVNINGESAPSTEANAITPKSNQIITFAALETKVFGDTPFTLSARSDSGLDISYSVDNPSVATIDGNTVTIVGAGTAEITALQAGNTNFNSAAVTQQLTVNRANQNITFASLTIRTYGDTPFTLSARSDSGLDISYSIDNPSVATIDGNTVTIVGAGTATITALQVGNNNYNAAVEVTQQLIVARADQSITFSTLSDTPYSSGTISLAATSTSGLPIAFSISDQSVATISNNEATILNPGRITFTASQQGNINYNAAIDISYTICITPNQPTVTTDLSNSSEPVLTSSSQSGNQWFLNGVAQVGATNQTYIVTSPGTITTQVTVGGCTGPVSDGTVIIVAGVEKSIEEVKLYPNPTDREIHLTALQQGPVEIQIIDNTGQTVRQFESRVEEELVIDVKEISRGVYLLKTTQASQSRVIRFVKK